MRSIDMGLSRPSGGGRTDIIFFGSLRWLGYEAGDEGARDVRTRAEGVVIDRNDV